MSNLLLPLLLLLLLLLTAPTARSRVVSSSALLSPAADTNPRCAYGGVLPAQPKELGGLSVHDPATAQVVDAAYWSHLTLGTHAACLDPHSTLLVNATVDTVHVLRASKDGRTQTVMSLMDAHYRPRRWAVFFGVTYTVSLHIATPAAAQVWEVVITTDVWHRDFTLVSRNLQSSESHGGSSCGGGGGSSCGDGDGNGNGGNGDGGNGNGGNVSVLSYNVWNTNGWSGRGERLAAAIRAVDADVVALQEVRVDTSLRDKPEMEFGEECVLGRVGLSRMDVVNQVVQLALLLPDYPYFVFQPAMSYPILPLGRVEEGLAVFSKTPLRGTRYALLSRDVTQDHMDVHQRIVLSTHTGGVHILQTHASLTPTARLRNMMEVTEFARVTQAPGSRVQVLVGDFNTDVANTRTGFGQSIEFALGRRRVASVFAAVPFRDAWHELRRRTGPTVDATGFPFGFTFPAHNATLRIDLVLYRSDACIPTAVDVVDGGTRARDHLLSDHLGVSAFFACPPTHCTH